MPIQILPHGSGHAALAIYATARLEETVFTFEIHVQANNRDYFLTEARVGQW